MLWQSVILAPERLTAPEIDEGPAGEPGLKYQMKVVGRPQLAL
jgi:hypothetical protein